MQRYRIQHQTRYQFSGQVQLGPHTLRLRPRESHELRIESSLLDLSPETTIRWHRDVEDNSVAQATFSLPCYELIINSDVVIQQYNETPLDFLVANYASHYPFAYAPEDRLILNPYLTVGQNDQGGGVAQWLEELRPKGSPVETYVMLSQLNSMIHGRLTYQVREEPGVQTAQQTLDLGTGSCRDFASLFISVARQLGLASRFVSGYLYVDPAVTPVGATHAWAEVYLPGAGWKGFDPTTNQLVGHQHIPVAVARTPESVPPVEGSFTGPPGATLSVGVQVRKIDD
ncbi:MAG: cysteine protease [Porticoccaceae bacterium]|nr:cysteine protease [Porticoccaceae bacterium]